MYSGGRGGKVGAERRRSAFFFLTTNSLMLFSMSHVVGGQMSLHTVHMIPKCPMVLPRLICWKQRLKIIMVRSAAQVLKKAHSGVTPGEQTGGQ